MKNKTLLVIFVERTAGAFGPLRKEDQAMHEHLLLDTIQTCIKVNQADRLLVIPPKMSKQKLEKMVASSAPIWQQDTASFTTRIREAFEYGFDQGYARIVLIGTQCPHLHEKILERARDLLGDFPLILGPLKEGGYYLVGESTYIPDIFTHLRGGPASPLQQMLKLTAELRIRVKLLPELEGIEGTAKRHWDPEELLELRQKYLREVVKSKKISISLN